LKGKEMPPDKRQLSLWELGGILRSLHIQGYTAASGYSFAESDPQFGKESIYVQAVAMPI